MPISPVMYERIAKFISTKPMQKVIRYADKNPALFQSGTIFAMSSILRPMAIMSTPADTDSAKKDRLYSASKSIASGITDLLFSIALFVPANKGINKFTRKLFDNKKSILYQDKLACKMYRNLLNRALKIATVPIVAFLNFRYVKDIANLITGGKNENK